ncbi:unnamed protein product [Orchesella dallaii]|uniref:C2H2-type domain-containing protein n=1 Tax=Orchesella dallaii TaxID=48710 RepID=A0ABP1RGY7_9HEXA
MEDPFVNKSFDYCLACCENVKTFHQDSVNNWSESVVVKREEEDFDLDVNNDNYSSIITSKPTLTEIFHCFLNLFMIKIPKNVKQKMGEWEKVFPFCVNCKSQLVSLLNLKKQVKDLEEEIKEMAIRSEEIFELVGVYNDENSYSYHEIRSKIVRKAIGLGVKRKTQPLISATVVNLRRSPRKAREHAVLPLPDPDQFIVADEATTEMVSPLPGINTEALDKSHEALEDPLLPLALASNTTHELETEKSQEDASSTVQVKRRRRRKRTTKLQSEQCKEEVTTGQPVPAKRRRQVFPKGVPRPPKTYVLADTITYHNVTLNKLGDGSMFSCSLCSILIRNDRQLILRHVVRYHTDLYVCSFPSCGLKVSSKAILQRHSLTHSKKDDDACFPCLICGRPFTNQRKVNFHKWTHFSEEDKNEAIAQGERPPQHHVKKFQCDICAFACHSKFVLKLHQNKRHLAPEERDKDRVLCTLCGKKVLYIQEHMDKTHGEKAKNKSWVCLICGKKFGYQAGLARHKKVVH